MLSTKGNLLTRFSFRTGLLQTFKSKSALYRYGGAVLTVLVVWLVRALLDPILQGRAAYLTFLIAVVYSAWSFGARPALLAVLFSGAVANYFFVQAGGRLGFTSTQEAVNFLLFAAIGVYIIDLINRQQRTVHQLQTLQSITADLSVASTPQEVLRVIVNRAFPTLGAQIGLVAFLSDDQSGVKVVASFGVNQEMLNQYQHIPFTTQMPISDAAQKGQPIWINSLDEYQQMYPNIAKDTHIQTDTQAIVSLPLLVNSNLIGSIGMTFSKPQKFKPAERDYILTIAGLSAQALLRAQLSERAQEQAVRADRQQLARDLHDSVSQTLFTINTLSQTGRKVMEKNPQQAQKQFEEVTQLSQKAIAEMRTLLLELRPTAIVKIPLKALVNQLIEAAQNEYTLTLTAQVELEQLLPELVHLALYRIIQEGLNNIVKHSHAIAASISLIVEGDELHLRIKDNGLGFTLSQTTAGIGLGSMRERAEAINATFEIVSQLNEGTEIRVKWPLPKEEKQPM